MSGGAREKLTSVQAMRGIAALAVVVYHTSLIMAHPEYGALRAFGRLTAPGWVGVNFFFVLSGFIILHAHERDIGVPARLPGYLWRRFARVYPIYWIVLTAFVVAALAGFGAVNFSTAPRDMLTAYTLLMWTPEPDIPLKVAWTLLFEIGFYAAFATLIWRRRVGLAVLAAWLAWILANAFVRHDTALGLGCIWGIHFYLGMAAHRLAKALPPGWGAPLLAAGVILALGLCYAGGLPPNPGLAQLRPALVVALAVPLAMILTGGVMLERSGRIAARGLPLLIGDASYAIYLVHSAAISAALIANRHFLAGVVPARPLFGLIAIAAVAAGIATHLRIEEPLLRWLRRVRPDG